MKVLSTYKILKSKAFNENIDESWIDWAIEMMEAGYESQNLHMLAGQTKPYNQFELQDLTSKVLQDLNLDYSNEESVTKNYVYYLISNSVNHPETYTKTLREIKDIYEGFDLHPEYQDFCFLLYAKDDLAVDTVQWYWEGATRENIDQIIKERFEKWMNEFQ
jgi:hypothetical protein